MAKHQVLALHALFFASGAVGLVYEVVWVRQLGNVFGNTVYGAAVVTAVFMVGLGVGAFVAGAWIDRVAPRVAGASLRAYGIAEVEIAVCAVALAVLLPRLGGLFASMSDYSPDSHGWLTPSVSSLAVRYLTATGLLLPPTVLMGATYTLVVRHLLERDLLHSGWRVGTLYGVNTAGAAVGALLTDGVLIPSVGVWRTQLAAVGVQGCVGVLALLLARSAGAAPAPQERMTATGDDRAGNVVPGELAAACASLFVSGFAALGMEMVWFRGLSAALGALRSVFSMVIAVILLGIWVGATVAGALERRFGRALPLFVLSQALFAATSLAFMATFSRSDATTEAHPLASIAYVLAVPAVLMGCATPLVNSIVQKSQGTIGTNAGALYLANSLGAVLGSVTASFLLAPHLGTQVAFVVFAGCAAAAPLFLVAAKRNWTRSLRVAVVLNVALSVPLIGGWLALPPTYVLTHFFPPLRPDVRPLTLSEGAGEVVVVTEDARGARTLMTNGHPMSGTGMGGQRYMRAFAHVPLLMMDRPASALVICFGVGNTVHAASLHPSLSRIDVADLSRNVLAHASYFQATNHDVLHDARVHVFVNDGRQHLRSQPTETYDLITLEPPPISFAGVSSLYSREFYELARSRLTARGFMTQWLPAYQVPPEVSLAAVRAFVDVFPAAVLLSGHGSELILVGTRQSELIFDVDAVEQRVRASEAVASDLVRLKMGTMTELVGMFIANGDALRRATASTSPITDDEPLLEYTEGRAAFVPPSLFALEGIHAYCPKCFSGGRPAPSVDWLDDYQRALASLYASPAFLHHEPTISLDPSGGVGDTVIRSDYLRALFAPETVGR